MPLEIGLSGLPNAVRMFSHTQFGLSFLILTFNDNATDYFARQQVLERLQGVDLPRRRPAAAGAALHAHRRDLPLPHPGQGRDARRTCAALQDWVVSRNLKLIPGVADVVSFGGFIKQYQVTVNTAQHEGVQRLAAAGVHGARPRQRQRRRQLPRAGRAAVPDSRHRHAALGRRHRQHRRRRARRHAAADSRHRRRQRSARCRARAWSARTTRTRSSPASC